MLSSKLCGINEEVEDSLENFFDKLSYILDRAPFELKRELLRHLEYLANKNGCSVDKILAGKARILKNQILTDAIANITSVLGVSPVQGDLALYNSTFYESLIRRYIHLLQPQLPANTLLVRIGNKNDGGYIFIDDFPKDTCIYSLGIGNDTGFDLHMASMGFPINMYDHTINRLPYEHELFYFSRVGIASKDSAPDFISFETMLSMAPAQHDNLILKMDIEGGEYDILSTISQPLLSRFRQIVIELHNLTRLDNKDATRKKLIALQKLNDAHQVVHVHANNNGAYTIISGIPFPDVLEVTWVRKKDFAPFLPSSFSYPIQGLDAPNIPYRADYALPFWGMR